MLRTELYLSLCIKFSRNILRTPYLECNQQPLKLLKYCTEKITSFGVLDEHRSCMSPLPILFDEFCGSSVNIYSLFEIVHKCF